MENVALTSLKNYISKYDVCSYIDCNVNVSADASKKVEMCAKQKVSIIAWAACIRSRLTIDERNTACKLKIRSSGDVKRKLHRITQRLGTGLRSYLEQVLSWRQIGQLKRTATWKCTKCTRTSMKPRQNVTLQESNLAMEWNLSIAVTHAWAKNIWPY